MYTTFYNLHRRPFENAPDPGMLYLSKQHREVLYSLIYGIEEAKGFVLLAGDVGTGKTTLVRALLKEIDGKHLVVNVVNPRVGFDDIYTYLLHKLGLQAVERLTLASMEALTEKLTVIHAQGQRVVLLIDEAHLLSEDSLEGIRLLSNIEKDQAKLIQIVLVGQNEIYPLLSKGSQKSLQQRIVVNRQLHPLDWTEAQGYISYRLSEAGRGTELFDSQAIALIWRASGGTPRVMNQICDNALMTGYAVEAEIVGRKIIQEVLNDMGPMRPKGRGQFLRQPFLLWPRWSIATFCFVVLVGLGVLGLNRQDNASVLPPIPQVNAKVAPQPVEIKSDIALLASEAPEQVAVAKVSPNETETKLSPPSVPLLSQEEVVLEELPLKTTSGLSGTGELSMPSNQSLWTMAERIYGGVSETLLDLIQMSNEGIEDINKVKDGQTLVFPNITRESLLGPGDDGKLHIHYASFYEEDNAQKVKEKLQKAGFDAFFVASRQGDIEVFRVYIGTFTQKEDAITVLNTVEFKNLPFLNGTDKEKRSYANKY